MSRWKNDTKGGLPEQCQMNSVKEMTVSGEGNVNAKQMTQTLMSRWAKDTEAWRAVKKVNKSQRSVEGNVKVSKWHRIQSEGKQMTKK